MLVVLMVVQLRRCYLSFVRAESMCATMPTIDSVQSMKVVVNISSSRSRAPDLLASSKETLQPDIDTPSKVQEQENAGLGANNRILNDYIGEFFADSEVTPIDYYKADIATSSGPEESSMPSDLVASSLFESTKLVSEVSGNKRNEKNSEADSDEMIVVESHARIQPVILDNESTPAEREVSDEESLSYDEDSVITVESEASIKVSDSKVMSEKVVHAMLDEARIVCPS